MTAIPDAKTLSDILIRLLEMDVHVMETHEKQLTAWREMFDVRVLATALGRAPDAAEANILIALDRLANPNDWLATAIGQVQTARAAYRAAASALREAHDTATLVDHRSSNPTGKVH